MDDLHTTVWVALSIHGAYTQEIKVYQLKANPKHSVTSIHQGILSAKAKQKSLNNLVSIENKSTTSKI